MRERGPNIEQFPPRHAERIGETRSSGLKGPSIHVRMFVRERLTKKKKKDGAKRPDNIRGFDGRGKNQNSSGSPWSCFLHRGKNGAEEDGNRVKKERVGKVSFPSMVKRTNRGKGGACPFNGPAMARTYGGGGGS